MIDKFRTFAQYRIVKWIFAIFLIIPFGLFGIDYYFRTPLGGDSVATVGKLRVSQGEYDQALRQQQETLVAQFGRNFDASIMENPEVRRSVLDRLINERLITLGAERSDVRRRLLDILLRLQLVQLNAARAFDFDDVGLVAMRAGGTLVGDGNGAAVATMEEQARRCVLLGG